MSAKTFGSTEYSSDSSVSEEEYAVEKIVDERRLRNGKTQYLIKWEGYHSIHNTWEDSQEIMRGASDAITEWEEEKKKHPRTISGLRKGRGKRASNCVCSEICGDKNAKLDKETGSQRNLPQTCHKVEENPNDTSSDDSEPFWEIQKIPKSVNYKKEELEPVVPKVDFVDQFEGQLNSLKTMVIQNWDKQLKSTQERVQLVETPLRQEIANLKEANGKMLESMKNLDLFMMHRKDRVESLQKEILELKCQLKSNEQKYKALNESAVWRLGKIQELQSENGTMKMALERVAEFFSTYLGFLVTPSFVSFFLPHVETKAMRNSADAEKLENFRKMLKE